MRLVVDIPDTMVNRQWMRGFKARWKVRLEQLELWLVSYRIEIEQLRVQLRLQQIERSNNTDEFFNVDV